MDENINQKLVTWNVDGRVIKTDEDHMLSFMSVSVDLNQDPNHIFCEELDCGFINNNKGGVAPFAKMSYEEFKTATSKIASILE